MRHNYYFTALPVIVHIYSCGYFNIFLSKTQWYFDGPIMHRGSQMAVVWCSTNSIKQNSWSTTCLWKEFWNKIIQYNLSKPTLTQTETKGWFVQWIGNIKR